MRQLYLSCKSVLGSYCQEIIPPQHERAPLVTGLHPAVSSPEPTAPQLTVNFHVLRSWWHVLWQSSAPVHHSFLMFEMSWWQGYDKQAYSFITIAHRRKKCRNVVRILSRIRSPASAASRMQDLVPVCLWALFCSHFTAVGQKDIKLRDTVHNDIMALYEAHKLVPMVAIV